MKFYLYSDKSCLYTHKDQRDTQLTTPARKKQDQEGMTMLVSLGFLLAIALIGSTAMNDMTLNSKVVSSTKNHYIALNNAEAALVSTAEIFQNPDIPPECNPNVNGLLNAKQTGFWWESFNWVYDGENKLFDGAPKESYIAVEPPVIGASPYSFDSVSHDNNVFYNYYRVTTRGQGANLSNAYVQGVFIMKQHKKTAC